MDKYQFLILNENKEDLVQYFQRLSNTDFNQIQGLKGIKHKNMMDKVMQINTKGYINCFNKSKNLFWLYQTNYIKRIINKIKF